MGKPARVKLTDKGFAEARRLAERPGMVESLALLEVAEVIYRKQRRRDRYRECVDGHLVTEAELLKELKCDMRRLEALALPSLEAGLLTSSTHLNGDVEYLITRLGQKALAKLEIEATATDATAKG